MEISPCCNSVADHQIATNVCTCHDITGVVSCTKFCSDHCISIEMRVKRNFHRIWIAIENPLVKRGPGCPSFSKSIVTNRLRNHSLVYVTTAWVRFSRSGFPIHVDSFVVSSQRSSGIHVDVSTVSSHSLSDRHFPSFNHGHSYQTRTVLQSGFPSTTQLMRVKEASLFH